MSQDRKDGFASLVQPETRPSLQIAVKKPVLPANALFTLQSDHPTELASCAEK